MKNIKLFVSFFFSLLFIPSILQAQTEQEFIQFAQSGKVISNQNQVKIPIEIWNELILLKIKINNHDATVMWDNGFSISGIDASLGKKFNLKPFGDKDNTISLRDGNNQTVNGEFLTADKVDINGISIINTPFLIFDSKALTLTKNIKLDGVLGSSIINKLNWNFNFDQNYVEVSIKPFNINSATYSIPFKIDVTNLHYIPVSFNGLPTMAHVDFGSNTDIIEVYRDNAPIFKQAKASLNMGTKSISVGGIAPVDTTYTIKEKYLWTLGNHQLKLKPRISFGRSNRNLVFGNKIFRDNYNVVINITNDSVYAFTERKKPELPVSENEFGYFILNLENQLKVVQVIPNENTDLHQLKLLEEIVSINGKKAKDFEDNYSLIHFQSQLKKQNQILELVLKNGKTIKLGLKPSHEYEYKNDEELWN